MGKSKLKKRYLKLSSRENFLALEVSFILTKKNIRKNDNFITLQEAEKLWTAKWKLPILSNAP